MFDYKKAKENIDKEKEKKSKYKKANMNKDEIELSQKVQYYQDIAEGPRQTAKNNGVSLEEEWKDNHKMYRGDHWDISLIKRSQDTKKHRHNMVKNLVGPTIDNMRDNICQVIPECRVDAMEEKQPEDPQELMQFQQKQANMPQIQPVVEGNNRTILAEKYTDMLKFNDLRDDFPSMYRRLILELLKHGPTALKIIFDNDFSGGSGPERWNGDIRTILLQKEEFFPDPAIIDLERNINKCQYINCKIWVKFAYLINRFENGDCVPAENQDDEYKDFGADPQGAYLKEHWHLGKPYFMTDKRKKELMYKAQEFRKDGDIYKAKEYEYFAKGEADGLHCGYIANGIYLDYIPHIYDMDTYNFAFRTRFIDEDNPLGFGEIKNLTLPNCAINKVEEMMLSAFAKHGLGNYIANESAVEPYQKKAFQEKAGKGGEIFLVNQIEGFRELPPTQVPPIFPNYIQSHEMYMEKSSGVTAIQRGLSPNSNTTLGAIQDLGSRTDLKNRSIEMIVKELLEARDRIRIKLMAQFYTNDRYYRIKQGKNIKVGKLSRKDMLFKWDRLDENNQLPVEIDEDKNELPYQEYFIPEFDVKVNVIDSKPHDRQYYESSSLTFTGNGYMTVEDMWETIENGKFPSKEEILKNLDKLNQAKAQGAQEQQQFEIQLKEMEYQYKLEIEKMKQETQNREIGRKEVETAYKQGIEEKKLTMEQESKLQELSKEDDPNKLMSFLQMYFPDTFNIINQLQGEQKNNIINMIINSPKEELGIVLAKIDSMFKQILNTNRG